MEVIGILLESNSLTVTTIYSGAIFVVDKKYKRVQNDNYSHKTITFQQTILYDFHCLTKTNPIAAMLPSTLNYKKQ